MSREITALITGASSGLGRAFALALAEPGAVLHLGGRHGERLEETAQACQALGAVARPVVLDVCDQAAMARWIGGMDRLDLVIANAAISAGTGPGEVESAGQARLIFATNLTGVLNTVLPAMEIMARQSPGRAGLRGRIAVIASIAAFVQSPGAPAYCASKAAVDAWAVALAPLARRRGIAIMSACPGFIRTPMTAANPFPMPGLMEPEQAARRILRALRSGRVRVAFPLWLALAARLTGLLPAGLAARLFATQPAKPATAPERST